MAYPDRARALWQQLRETLCASRSLAEAEAEAYWLLEHFAGLGRTQVIVDASVANLPAGVLENALERLAQHEPIQYVLGEAWFYGRAFHVAPGVLIPRPETEELVQKALELHPHPHGIILDVGTGSGCIPITLKAEQPAWQVYGLDVSTEALQIAQTNANQLEVEVQWLEVDILHRMPEVPPLDLLISNPPYVRRLEAEQMEVKVLDHEPHLALFVENEEPLLFYRRLADLAPQLLKSDGWLATEINEALGAGVADLYHRAGLQHVAIYKDMQGKDRVVVGQKP